MLGINKITVSDKIDERGNNTYVVEVSYYLQTGKDDLGLPALDLSKNTRLYANFEAPYGRLVRQKLTFPTFLGTELNPDIEKISTGYRYPFIARFDVDAEESLNFVFEFQLFLDTKPYDREKRITLFSGGELQIKNDDSIPIEDKRSDFYDSIFNVEIFSSTPLEDNSSVSELYSSYSKQDSLRGMFILDKQKLLMTNSTFGYLLSNPKIPKDEKRKMMSMSDIEHIEITRRKLAQQRDFHNRPYPSYKDQAPQTIATATSVKGILGATRGVILQIKDLNLEDMEYENIIAFNDNDLSDMGKHQYTLNMVVRDGILNWLISATDRLIRIQNNLKIGSPIVDIGDLVKILFVLNQNLNITQTSLKSYLINLRAHQGSLNMLKNYITYLVSILSTVIGNAGVISQVNSSYSKVYSTSNTSRFFLNLNKRFDESIDFSEAASLTYDYMNFPSNNEVGATSVDRGTMQTRFDGEYNKILREQPESSFVNLSREIYADVFGFSDASGDPLKLAYFNFETNYYAFLSPTRIGDLEINNETAFNFDLLTQEHFKKKYDDKLNSEISVSYYLQEHGVSVGEDFFREDPPLKDASQSQTYLAANEVFSNNDNVNQAPAVTQGYKEGLKIEPMKAASRLFASNFLRNEEGWNLSREDFDLTNTTNIISSVTDNPSTRTGRSAPVSSSAQLKIVRELPNQIRAIFASKSDKCVKQWLSPSMKGDYIYSPSTYYTIKQNYMNLLEIEYLAGFQKDENGLPDVKNPIFKKLRSLTGTGKILCRASIYNDQRFRIGVAFDNVSYADKYFILDLAE